jgi:glycosyltransferase involved in cell wall biosynthesis
LDPKKKRILILHGSNDLYGASNILLKVIDILKELGFEVHVILPYSGSLDSVFKGIGVQFSFYNLGILRKKYFTFKGVLNRLFKIKKTISYITTYIKKHNIDVVYSNGSVILAGGFSAKKCNIKSIYHFHEIPSNKMYIRIMGLILNTVSDKVIVVSDAVGECWKKYFKNGQITRIYNGVSTDDNKYKISNNSKYTLTAIGRILPLKGHKYLIEIAKLLVKKKLIFRVNIIGDPFKCFPTVTSSG